MRRHHLITEVESRRRILSISALADLTEKLSVPSRDKLHLLGDEENKVEESKELKLTHCSSSTPHLGLLLKEVSHPNCSNFKETMICHFVYPAPKHITCEKISSTNHYQSNRPPKKR